MSTTSVKETHAPESDAVSITISAAGAEEARRIIDETLSTCSQRELISADEITDVLLDIRTLIHSSDKASAVAV